MGVEFEEENSVIDHRYSSRAVLGASTTPKLINFFLKTGIAKTEKQAGAMVMVLIVVCFLISLYFLFYAVFGKSVFDIASIGGEKVINNPMFSGGVIKF